MNTRRYPDFGNEPKRPFEVCEHCYDCTEFYSDCNAWPQSKSFRCADYHPLPDVLPGTCGQAFPPSRMQGRKEPRELAAPDMPPSEPRHCDCGETLAKGRRLCDQCRSERRRQTKRDAMRTYRKQRQSATVQPDSDVPLPAQGRLSTHALGHDLPSKGTRGRNRRFRQTTVLHEGSQGTAGQR